MSRNASKPHSADYDVVRQKGKKEEKVNSHPTQIMYTRYRPVRLRKGMMIGAPMYEIPEATVPMIETYRWFAYSGNWE